MSRWARFWLVFIMLLCGSSAHAMTVAPMCDASGASIAAPIPVLPLVERGEIKAIPACDDVFAVGLPSPRDSANDTVTPEVPPPALAAAFTWMPPRSTPRARAVGVCQHLSPGHILPVYRPPRA